LLALRLDYSRIQLFGSGLLTVFWLISAARVRARLFVRTYAVVPVATFASMPVLRTCRWLPIDDAVGRSVRVDGVVADLGIGLSDRELAEVTRAAIAGVPVLDRRYIVENLTGRTPLAGLAPNEYGALLPSRQYLVIRRMIELSITAAALPFLLPFLILIALAIRLDSTGPVFFVQNRTGYRGRAFRVIKFRTMVDGSRGPSFTTRDDSRVTRVGTFLRRYRLDELPQIFNILRGNMSWVGPRPEALQLGDQYHRDIPHFELRGIVRPGITGWAQVNQGYAHTPDEMRAKVEYDLYYLKHCSLWLDLFIVVRTIGVVLGGAGAR
jgi:lipopolysaccharide/colanic/teichoic acid biosynthesis glycosyltransferase